jgi:hypothetical protein
MLGEIREKQNEEEEEHDVKAEQMKFLSFFASSPFL